MEKKHSDKVMGQNRWAPCLLLPSSVGKEIELSFLYLLSLSSGGHFSHSFSPAKESTQTFPGLHLFQALFKSTCLLLLPASPVACKLPEGQRQARLTYPFYLQHRAQGLVGRGHLPFAACIILPGGSWPWRTVSISSTCADHFILSQQL